MLQQPTQMGQWPIPGPPQHYYPYPQTPQPSSVPSRVGPYPVDLQTHLYNQFTPEAHPYPVPLPQHWGGYPQGVGVPPVQAQRFYPSAPPSVQPFYNQYPTQGLGQQVPVPPVYSAASPLVQPYYQHTQQGLGQPPPVVAAEESAVKRGKRKAVELDDARPLKKQPIQYSAASPSAQPYHQHTRHGLGQPPPVVAAEESAVMRGKRKAVDLDDARPLKKQAIKSFVNDFGFGHIELTQHQNYMAQFPFPDSHKVISRGDSSYIGGSPSKTQEEVVAQVPCEASNTPLEFSSNSFEGYNWTPSEPLEEPAYSFDHSELICTKQAKELFLFDSSQKAANVASGELEVVNSTQETDIWASDNLLEGFTISPSKTGDMAPDDLMNSFVKAEDPDLVGKLLRKLIEHWFP